MTKMLVFPERERIAALYYLLTAYNGVVVLVTAGFMSLTQQRIIDTMAARAFLGAVPIIPEPAAVGFLTSLLAFLVVVGMGYGYRQSDEARVRYVLFAAEVIACMLLIRSLNLAYDGVVLLVVADLMHRYEGRRQSYVLVASMLGLYFIASYNLAVFQGQVAPIDAYVSYYAAPVQGVLQAVRSGFISLNIIIFVSYLVLLVQSKHRETERIAELNRELGIANEKLRTYAIEAEHLAETRERNRLAREIHDTLGHALTGIAAGLDATTVLVDAAPDAAKMQLAKIRETALRGIKDVRRSVKKLRPGDLEKLPIQMAIARMTAEFSASSRVQVKLVSLGWPQHLQSDEEDVIYRVVQEGLTNAERHGHASHITVTIGTEARRLYIIIADNGTGAAGLEEGFGLRHMRERLELLSGRLRYYSDGGFTLEATIPLRAG